jgi:hypothetical protein
MGDAAEILASQDEKAHANILQGLKGTDFEPSNLERLSGGLVNWGYRVHLQKPLDDGTSVVFLKHGERFIAKVPNYEADTLRCVSTTAFPRYSRCS